VLPHVTPQPNGWDRFIQLIWVNGCPLQVLAVQKREDDQSRETKLFA
jgi:hypothetical protein